MFPANFTLTELRSGTSMIVHPITGTPMSVLHYDANRKAHYRSVARSGWDADPDDVYEPMIPAPEAGVTEGDVFPHDWNINPYTGVGLPGVY